MQYHTFSAAAAVTRGKYTLAELMAVVRMATKDDLIYCPWCSRMTYDITYIRGCAACDTCPL